MADCAAFTSRKDVVGRRNSERLRFGHRATTHLKQIDKRLSIYRGEIYLMLNYLNDNGVPTVHMRASELSGKFMMKLRESYRRIVEGANN